jgi:hypothetical protein
VVGSMGNAMPIIPRISEIVPTMRKISFIMVLNVQNKVAKLIIKHEI